MKIKLRRKKKKNNLSNRTAYKAVQAIKDGKEEQLVGLKHSVLANAFADALEPKPRWTISQWADKFRILPETSAHEAGLWRTSRFPFLRRPMDCLSPFDPCKQVVIMKGAQVGCTEISLNWMFYTIDYNPVPMLYVQKTLDNIGIFMDQRWDPAVDAMPEISDKIGAVKTGRGTGNTKRTKLFPGGMARFGGANSASSLRSMPICNLTLDEEDSYDQDIQEEGSPSKLAIARTRNFPNRKIFRLSTPTLKEISVIEPLFEKGTKEYYHVPCPHCGAMENIKWENIKWEKDELGRPILNSVALLCVHCGVLIEEHHKTKMLAKGKWVATNPGASYPSFHVSSLYSPYGFYSWKEAVEEWYDAYAVNDPSLLKTFVNTVLGETWETAGRSLKASFLAQRKYSYEADVPEDVVILTSATDVQDNRVETEICGWTVDRQCYSINYKIHLGDTKRPEIWQQLKTYLMKHWKHASGQHMPLAISFIDSGYLAADVYKFCRMLEQFNIFPVDGRPGWGKGEIDRPKRRNKAGVYLYGAFVDELKLKTVTNLQIEVEGPGYCHFPNKPEYTEDYFAQLTSEKLEKVWVGGGVKLKWSLPKGKRNEAFDCRVYNHAALLALNPDLYALKPGQLFKPAFGKRHKRQRKVISAGI